MVYPARKACVNHQSILCYQGKDLSDRKSTLKLEQVQWQCRPCGEKASTLKDFKSHVQSEAHRECRAKQTQSTVAAGDRSKTAESAD